MDNAEGVETVQSGQQRKNLMLVDGDGVDTRRRMKEGRNVSKT